MANAFQAANSYVSNRVYSMTDNTFINIFQVSLPTANTSCCVFMLVEYSVTDGVNAGNHAGLYLWSISNNAGTVSGAGGDTGEITSGTGAGAGIDTLNVAVVGTLATAQIRYNTPLNVAGSLTMKIIGTTATTLVIL